MTPRGYHDLPRSQRQEIVDHVRGAIATFNGPTLDGDDLADLVRWTIDGLFRTSAFEDAYEEALEVGRERGYLDAISDAELVAALG